MAELTAYLNIRMSAPERARLQLIANEVGIREAAIARNALRLGLDAIAAAARETENDLPLEVELRDITDREKWQVTSLEPVET